MTEIQMQKMITKALEQRCNCKSGGECPSKWHTWNRPVGRGAICFVGKDSGSQRGRFKLNVPPQDIRRFLKEARTAGFWAQRDPDNPNLRVEVSLGRNPSLDKIELCEVWIQRAKTTLKDDFNIEV